MAIPCVHLNLVSVPKPLFRPWLDHDAWVHIYDGLAIYPYVVDSGHTGEKYYPAIAVGAVGDVQEVREHQ